jgi:hypothetical protein
LNSEPTNMTLTDTFSCPIFSETTTKQPYELFLLFRVA